MADPEQDPMSYLIRRADAYAHTEYYGQGLIECLADNRRLAEEFKAEVRAEARGCVVEEIGRHDWGPTICLDTLDAVKDFISRGGGQ